MRDADDTIDTPKPTERGEQAARIRRRVDAAALFLIGDGILGILDPRGHVALIDADIAPVALTRFFAGRPGLRRLYGALQVGAGLALASRGKRG